MKMLRDYCKFFVDLGACKHTERAHKISGNCWVKFGAYLTQAYKQILSNLVQD